MNRDHVLTHDYLFDDFVLHANGAMSFHGQDVSIPPKELQVLVTLLEGKGNLVHKNAIIDKVWGDNLVGDESLTRCIYSLRRLLRESKNNKFIETVYGKGYRFCKPVTAVQQRRNPAQGCKLAILPFGGGERNEAQLLHARLMDAISGQLHAGISLVPAALMRWQGMPDELLALCRQLELDCYLTGEFCLDGDQRLLTVELVDALGQSLLFRETFQPGASEAWSLQLDAIAERILSRLPLANSEPVSTASGEVMVSHVMARHGLRRREYGDLSMAQQYLQMGLMQDPLHVPSLVAMAETSLALSMQGAIWPVRAFSEARRSLEKALSLAPNQSTALSVMAWLTRLSGDNETVAISLLRQAQGQPGASAEVNYYHALHHVARCEYATALDMLHASLARDKGLAPALWLKLWVLHAMGRNEEAHIFAIEQAEQGEPAPLFHAVHALVLAEMGCHDQAHLYAGTAIQAAPDNLPEGIIQQWVGAICQQPGEANEFLARWLGESRSRYSCPGLLACLALSLGEEVRASALIRLAREQRCVWWPMVKGLPRMSAFLASEPSETCWI